MGFFKKIINLFSSSIECPDKYSQDLFYNAPVKHKRIKLGQTLFVRENYVAVIVVKNKVADVFKEGRHKLVLASMPKVGHIVNFRARKNKKPKDRFKAEVYFINLKDFALKVEKVFPIIIRDENLGKIKGRLNASISYSISNPIIFLKVCFLNWAYINLKKVNKKIKVWVVETILENFDTLKPSALSFAKNESYLSEEFFVVLEKKLESYGIKLNDFKITETFVPSAVSELLFEFDNSARQEENIIVDAYPAQNNILSYDKRLPSYGNEFKSDAYDNNMSRYELDKSNVLIDEQRSFNDKNIKACNNCGTLIDKSSNVCYNCGSNQESVRTCPHCNNEVDEGEFVCPHCKNIIL